MREMNVIVVGDSMFDCYFEGDVDRISPEAPCPVVDIFNVAERAGGAANVAMNLASLQVQTNLVTILGAEADDKGAEALTAIIAAEKNIKLWTYHVRDYMTPIKNRVCDSYGQQLIRFDMEDGKPFNDPAAYNALWQHLEHMLQKAANSKLPSVLVLSDYGKGVFTDSRFLTGVLDLAAILKIPTIVDPKHKDLTRYNGAYLIKPNLKEARAALNEENSDIDAEGCATRLMTQLHPAIKGVLVTEGGNGMALAVPIDGKIFTQHIPAFPARQFANVTGAGDVVTAVLARELACLPAEYDDNRYSFRTAAKYASIAAGVVTGKTGTALITPWDFDAALEEFNMVSPDKTAELDVAVSVCFTAKSNGDRIILTSGSFDQIHPGHLHLLQKARHFGDMLVVALQSDDAIKRLKGPNRPFVPGTQRAAMLAAMQCVDLIVFFDEDTPERVIKALKPQLLVAGKEYYDAELSKVPGATTVVQNGGGVMFIDMLEGFGAVKQPAKASEAFG